jgi:serine phosphatase RsbU (regulator of sigma subunit)
VTWTWGAVCRPKQNQPISGDIYLVLEQAGGQLLVVVVDGLGGGEEAAHAARAAEQVIREHVDWPLQDLVQRSHIALHSTRGAVIGLLRLDPHRNKASYVGVGNIGVQVYSRQSIKPISKNGILGFRLPTLLEMHYIYDPGDIFILYSDGISARFALDGQVDIRQPPQCIADKILGTYGKQIDDATIVVIKTAPL